MALMFTLNDDDVIQDFKALIYFAHYRDSQGSCRLSSV